MLQIKQDGERGVNLINGTELPSPSVSPPSSRSGSPSPRKDGEPPRPKRFMNGWTKEQEKLMADWSDICTVYKWCHTKAEQLYYKSGLSLNLIIIIISSLAGFSNIGVQSLMEGNPQGIKLASFAIGGISLLSSILTTIGNTLKWTALSESHRVAGIGWGKFGRQISVELALHPNERIDSIDFLKICRAELDRLIEQSPQIPIFVIKEFENKFGDIKDLKRPEICGKLEHTKIYTNSEERLKMLAVEAALMLRKKKDMLKELIQPDVEEHIAIQVNKRIEIALEERKKKLEEELEAERRRLEEQEKALQELAEERKNKLEQEIELEKKKALIVQQQQQQQQQQQHQQQLTGIDDGATAPSLEKLVASSFENRLTMNRSGTRSRSASVRRRSITGDGIYTLETQNSGQRGIIRVNDLGVHTVAQSKTNEKPKNEIIIVDKE